MTSDQDHRPVARPTQAHGEEPSQLNQDQGAPVVETAVEARQGFKGKPMLIVLGASLLLAVIAGVFLGAVPL